MDLEVFLRLKSDAGQRALHDACNLHPKEVDFLRHYTSLCRKYPVDLARAALEIAVLRERAREKIPFAEGLYFTKEALEQASAWEVSTYRVERYRSYPLLVDLGCSVGGDTLALAGIAPVLGVDIDPLRLAMARANLDARWAGYPACLIQADLRSSLPFDLKPGMGLFFDPARRSHGQRIHSVKDYRPPLEGAAGWFGNTQALGVKISPGVNLAELSGYDAEVEFISLRGELKEAVLWFGTLKSSERRATVLPGPYSMRGRGPERAENSLLPGALDLPLSEPQAVLYEPDPAVLRAGLVANLGVELGASQLDPDIAYLTAEKYTPTPFARGWEVDDWFPFQLKRLRSYLRERGVGRLTVKKRGSPLKPEELIHSLRLSGEQERLLFLTHLRGRPIAVIARVEPLT
jgi:SAM-dependent methyltransferase